MDGVMTNNKGVFVLGATNRPWDIDNAFKRGNRFEEVIYVTLPTLSERIKIFKYYCDKIKNKNKINYIKLGMSSFGMSPSDISQATNNAVKAKVAQVLWANKKQDPVSTKDILKELKKIKSILPEWYQKTYLDMQKLPPEERSSYKELLKDCKFWQKNAKSYKVIFSILAFLASFKLY